MVVAHIAFTTSVQLDAWTHLFTQSLPRKAVHSALRDFDNNTYQYHKDRYIQTSNSLPSGYHELMFIISSD